MWQRMTTLSDAAKPLKLLALDAEDLTVLSALMQDAITRASEMRYLEKERAFVLVADRLAREAAEERSGLLGRRTSHQRRRTALDLRRVSGARFRGFDRNADDEPLVLLAVTHEGEGTGGSLTLAFAGGATVRCDVETVEARLTDLGPAWKSEATPDHAA